MRDLRQATSRGDATLRRLRARLAARKGDTLARRDRKALLVAVALAASLAAGCGGGGGDRLAKDDFQLKANAICKRYDDKIAALGAPASIADIPQFVNKTVPLIQQALAELRALRPPAELQDDWTHMLDETEKAIPAARKLSDAAARNDAAGVQKALKAGNAATKASDRIATRLGLTQCAAG